MSITLILIIVTVGYSLYAWNNENLYYRSMLNPYDVVHRRQYWRLVSSGFVHAGYVHLGFNMFTFYFFGGVTEQIFSYVLALPGVWYLWSFTFRPL